MNEAQATLTGKQPAKPQPPRPEVTVTNNKKKPDEEKETFEIMERRDEDQITRVMQGELIDEFVYSFKLGNRQVTGLSWLGVKEVMRRLGNIRLGDLQIVDKPDEYQVIVKATDTKNNVEMYGASTQSKADKSTKQPDGFALQKAVSKAQRNAIRGLLPEKQIAIWLRKFSEEKKAK